MYEDASEARYTAAPTISPGRPVRPSGMSGSTLLADWSGTAPSGTTMPGHRALTRIAGASSLARYLVIIHGAAFVAP